jgi:predicted nucleotidyltransferase
MAEGRRLRQFARDVCLPHLTTLDRFASHRDRLSFMLVGSVATGLCDESSDVDIAVVCDQSVYDAISSGTDWDRGRPTEEHLDGVQLQYYGIAFEEIERKLAELDDACLHVYSTAVPLMDADGQYFKRLERLLTTNPAVRRERVEGKLDMLIRRSRALGSAVDTGDVVSIADVCLEMVRRILAVVALLDDTGFDPRKRLFTTALRGELGRRLEPRIRELLSAIGELGECRGPADLEGFTFPGRVGELIALLSDEARKQGFRVGLESPDRRQV